MKRLIYILLAALALISGGCTQSEGHIGTMFGSWVLTDMIIDGQPTQSQSDDYTTMSFQSNIVNFKLVDGRGYATGRWGTWTRLDNRLTFDFTHSTDANPSGAGAYQGPTWLGFPAQGVVTVEITQLTDSHFDFIRRTDNEEVVIYKFERTW